LENALAKITSELLVFCLKNENGTSNAGAV
jgi:hypothetical protein